jgi:S-DNA-T family DNA segregation ATPase FtsK/SpoIIIE
LAESTARANSGKFTAAVTRGLRESAAIAMAVVALVMLTALVTYSPQDPAFTFAGDSTEVHNAIGPVGALFADVLFFLFGRPAFLFPVMLGAWCWNLFRSRKNEERTSRANTAVRIAGFAMVLIASCGLTTYPGLRLICPKARTCTWLSRTA